MRALNGILRRLIIGDILRLRKRFVVRAGRRVRLWGRDESGVCGFAYVVSLADGCGG